MPDSVSEYLSRLPRLYKADLDALWRQFFKAAPPCQLRKSLLLPILAFRIQEQAFGAVSPRCHRRLRQLARELENHCAGIKTCSDPLSIKAGTRLIRQWREQTHVVTVENNGYEYRGSLYRSLSVIARQITGTRWSGPLFFGVHRNKTSDRLEGK